jgi:hypothetical protein
MTWLPTSIGIVILLGHMPRLEECFLYHSLEDLFNIMSDYLDGVWFQEMMQLILSDETDSDDGAHDLIMR